MLSGQSIRADIVQRVLLTYRLRPQSAAPLLPDGLSPDLHQGWAFGGVCFIELRSFGRTTLGAAHRIAAIDQAGNPQLWIPHRLTNSRLQARLGPTVGLPHERVGRISVTTSPLIAAHAVAADGEVEAAVEGTPDEEAATSSVFGNVTALTDWYRQRSLGLSPVRRSGADGSACGVALHADRWQMSAVRVDHASSTMFDELVDRGDAELDHVLTMQPTSSTWTLGVTAGV